jgi:hypothetical protein
MGVSHALHAEAMDMIVFTTPVLPQSPRREKTNRPEPRARHQLLKSDLIQQQTLRASDGNFPEDLQS